MPQMMLAVAMILGVTYCVSDKFDKSSMERMKEACQSVHDGKRMDINGFYEKYCNADGTLNEEAALKVVKENEGK